MQSPPPPTHTIHKHNYEYVEVRWISFEVLCLPEKTILICNETRCASCFTLVLPLDVILGSNVSWSWPWLSLEVWIKWRLFKCFTTQMKNMYTISRFHIWSIDYKRDWSTALFVSSRIGGNIYFSLSEGEWNGDTFTQNLLSVAIAIERVSPSGICSLNWV